MSCNKTHESVGAVQEAIAEALAITPCETQVTASNLEDCDCVPIYVSHLGRTWRLDSVDWHTSYFLTWRSWLEATYTLLGKEGEHVSTDQNGRAVIGAN